MRAVFNAVRELILGSSMRPEGEFLLAEIAKQDGEITDLRAQLVAAVDVKEKAERDAHEADQLRSATECELHEARATSQRQAVEIEKLRAAARLAVLNFERQLEAGADLFDDDHEAWTALNAAMKEKP